MYAKTVQMTGKGQIVVPIEIRKAMGLTKGSKLIIIQNDESISLKRPETLKSLIEEDMPEVRAMTEKVFGEVWEDEPEGLWEEYIKC
jgi:AbrB family looped-hinge helix DNA binding protein